MAARKRKKKPKPSPAAPPRLHEAALDSGPSGWVLRGTELDVEAAVARRAAGLDVVVCGDDVRANRQVARSIEAAVGPPTHPQPPHRNAGPHALPHFHQQSREPGGHTFYETDNPARKSRKQP